MTTNRELARALDHLRDEQRTLTPKTLRALSDLTRSELVDLQSAWGQISTSRRQMLLAALVTFAQEHIEVSFNLFLRWLLSDDDPIIRHMAIAGLWEDDDDTLVQLLAPLLLTDPVSDVRASAAEALGRFVLLGELDEASPPAKALAVESLLASLDRPTEVSAVRRLVVEAIAYASEPDVRPIVHQAYTDTDALMRASAVHAMGNTGDDYWWPQVRDELHNAEPGMRAQAAYAAGELEVADAVPQLVRMIDDAEEEVRVAAVRALGHIGGSKARQALVKVARSDDLALSEIARDALSELEFTALADLSSLLARQAAEDHVDTLQQIIPDGDDELEDDDIDWDDEESWNSEEAWDAEDWETDSEEDSFDDEDDFDDDALRRH